MRHMLTPSFTGGYSQATPTELRERYILAPSGTGGYEIYLILTLYGLPKNKTDHAPMGNSYGVKGEIYTSPQFHWGLFTGNSYGVFFIRALM